nr:hypothetical protein [Massilia sp. JS1662]
MHDAIVEAALKIEQRFGTYYARALMRHEGVPEEVAIRVTAPGPRQVRARKIGQLAGIP